MGFFEIEQKYRLKDPAKVRVILKQIGAKRIASGVETNEFYDQGGFFRKQKVALRLRRFGRGLATMTLKGPRIKARFTKRMEIETPVDLAAAKAFLKFLGCQVWGQYSKRRELYRLSKTAVTVDFLKKFGWFLEIEGQPRSIREIEKKLGLRNGDREERSYLQMLFQ
ncbi:MAG: class IV adenylate cyclase [Candidatus Omnitrophota bacterium]